MGAEFVRGRVCQGPSLLGAEMSRNPILKPVQTNHWQNRYNGPTGDRACCVKVNCDSTMYRCRCICTVDSSGRPIYRAHQYLVIFSELIN